MLRNLSSSKEEEVVLDVVDFGGLLLPTGAASAVKVALLVGCC
jgi:hypothetical protein